MTICETASIDNEGAVSVGALLDSDYGLARHIVQVPGSAIAIDVAVLRRAMS